MSCEVAVKEETVSGGTWFVLICPVAYKHFS